MLTASTQHTITQKGRTQSNLKTTTTTTTTTTTKQQKHTHAHTHNQPAKQKMSSTFFPNLRYSAEHLSDKVDPYVTLCSQRMKRLETEKKRKTKQKKRKKAGVRGVGVWKRKGEDGGEGRKDKGQRRNRWLNRFQHQLFRVS